MERNLNSGSRVSIHSRISSTTPSVYDESGSEACSTRLSSRLATASSTNGERMAQFSCPPGLKKYDQLLVGESVKASPIRSLSALYRPTFKRLPAFPSIYETKYQRDFQYIPFPVPKSCKENKIFSKFDGFKFGTTTNATSFTHHENGTRNNHVYINSIHARHKPQPKINLAQNYPNQYQWVWNQHNKIPNRVSSGPGSMYNKPYNTHDTLKMHRWNSR